jgi:hypothetical protein
VLWKALPKHNPTKLDSTQNSLSTASGNFPKSKYTQCHINYYYKNISPKIPNLVCHASKHLRVPLKIGNTTILYTKLQICNFDKKGAYLTRFNSSNFTRAKDLCMQYF